ncbi:hypothetical protein [Anaerostipes sp. 494a]|uniref:hypothetical protein n=1 Tax=Anaerostipes sp. 494a TaxID=1261636 RepID=UPI001301950D|nr:hypothetical protein [Anaerostipes sp. 494a]
MRFLKRMIKTIFYNYYGVEPLKKDNLYSACEGRIIRSLSGKKQKYYAVNILSGLK